MNKFVIFSSGYNCNNYIINHIESVQYQTYRNFTHILVDDASTDNTYKSIQKATKNLNNTIVYRNKVNQKWIFNALQYLKADDNDIIVLLDMDDWFTNVNVLDILNDEYNNNDCWITYSKFYYMSKKITSDWIPRYTRDDIINKKFRQNIWSFTHLRTFKYFLWKHIKDEDLRDNNGEYFKCTYDQAIFYPMLEMSSPNHIHFIDKVLYSYNDNNPLQVEKINRKEQENNAQIIKNKKIYNSL